MKAQLICRCLEGTILLSLAYLMEVEENKLTNAEEKNLYLETSLFKNQNRPLHSKESSFESILFGIAQH